MLSKRLRSATPNGVFRMHVPKSVDPTEAPADEDRASSDGTVIPPFQYLRIPPQDRERVHLVRERVNEKLAGSRSAYRKLGSIPDGIW